MTSDERGKEVTEALAWGVNRETVSIIREMTEGLDVEPGTIIGLARELHTIWPGRPDRDRARSMEAHIARATARFPLAKPRQAQPPPPPAASLPPGSIPGMGLGRQQSAANSYHRVYQDLERTRKGPS
jgi:hypothetical protein